MNFLVIFLATYVFAVSDGAAGAKGAFDVIFNFRWDAWLRKTMRDDTLLIIYKPVSKLYRGNPVPCFTCSTESMEIPEDTPLYRALPLIQSKISNIEDTWKKISGARIKIKVFKVKTSLPGKLLGGDYVITELQVRKK